MSLTEYKNKRDFDKTNEPKPSLKHEGKKLKYSIQEHNASHLHWDLRLESGGVLKSWAIPKSPLEINDGKTKRLAVQTEDHPIEYWNFKGKIPEGNYGAGTVKIWDKGDYTQEKFSNNEIIIKIKGKKLNGKYILLKTNYGKKPNKSWLFFKGKD